MQGVATLQVFNPSEPAFLFFLQGLWLGFCLKLSTFSESSERTDSEKVFFGLFAFPPKTRQPQSSK